MVGIVARKVAVGLEPDLGVVAGEEEFLPVAHYGQRFEGVSTRFGEILSGSNWYSLRILFWSSTWDSIGDKVYSGEGKRGFGKLFMCEPYMDKSPMAS